MCVLHIMLCVRLLSVCICNFLDLAPSLSLASAPMRMRPSFVVCACAFVSAKVEDKG